VPEHHPLPLLHVVRRYGPVGGMERYVFELTQALHARGHAVTVLCERCHQPPAPGVEVHEIGEVRPKPRWLASLRFSGGVERWVRSRPQGWIIHSHERTALHDVTTFHGPPFATVRARPLWRRLSLRIGFQLYLERRELAVARAVVPVSRAVSAQLAAYYPDAAGKLTAPVIPGVLPGALRPERTVPAAAGVIGFVGKEWRRKGLELAVQTVAKLRQQRPDAELWVVGPQPDDVRHLFAGWDGGHRLLGWRHAGLAGVRARARVARSAGSVGGRGRAAARAAGSPARLRAWLGRGRGRIRAHLCRASGRQDPHNDFTSVTKRSISASLVANDVTSRTRI
jgi:UDP-glucose:(heptosyl)LPS alpha-1,3-glucosyltransferase